MFKRTKDPDPWVEIRRADRLQGCFISLMLFVGVMSLVLHFVQCAHRPKRIIDPACER